jgi:NMD protein affecting ribosome stability and mRNA decay
MPIRKEIHANRDPYLSPKGQKELAVCTKCGAVYRHKRWSLELPVSELKGVTVRKVMCPACQKTRDRYAGGIVTLRGSFLKEHNDEIVRRIKNEEARAKKVNPLERVILLKNGGDVVEVQTTSERFAQRIGREIKRAYKGKVEYHWSADDKFVRVDWQRS